MISDKTRENIQASLDKASEAISKMADAFPTPTFVYDDESHNRKDRCMSEEMNILRNDVNNGLTDADTIDMIRMVNEQPKCIADKDGGKVTIHYRPSGAWQDFVTILVENGYEITVRKSAVDKMEIEFRRCEP